MRNFGRKLCHFDKCGRIARPPSSCPSRTYVRLGQLLYNFVHATYKICACDLQNMCMRPTKVVHPTYKSCASNLNKLCIRPTKPVYPTYKTCASVLLLQLCIRSTKICVSDLRKLCIRPTCATGTSILMVALPTTTTYNGYICIMQFLLGRINKIECTFDLQLS